MGYHDIDVVTLRFASSVAELIFRVLVIWHLEMLNSPSHQGAGASLLDML